MQEAQPVQEVDVNNVVVLPTSVRQDTVRTRVTTMIVCADPGRAASLDSAMGAMGLDTTVLAAGSQVREYADRHSPPDTCFIVTPLPDGPVLPLIRMLRSRGWHKVTVLSGHADARAVHAALLADVRAVIVQPDSQQSVQPTVRPKGSAHLSERELEVLRMVADGQTNRVVGDKLGLSALTVKSHLARIARKLGSGDRAQMVATAIRNGYIR
jgi:DNA-binding NarL/FixJ family response regulator